MKCTSRDIPPAEKLAAETRKPVTLSFGSGLMLFVTPAGTKSWRTHATLHGKRQIECLGHFPAMGVKQALAAREAIRTIVRDGGNPAANRHTRRAKRQAHDAATVRVVAERWIAEPGMQQRWTVGYRHNLQARLENHVFPIWGDRPIASIHQTDVTALIGAMWRPREEGGRGIPSQAVGVSHHLACLFDYAVAHDLIAANPVRKIRASLPRRKSRGPGAEQPQAFVRKLEDAQRILAAIESSNAGPFLKLAHRAIALTGSRKMEGIEAAWSELSKDCWIWTIPAERMKTGEEHVIYLSAAARDVFLAAHRLATAGGIRSLMCFPGAAKSGACHHSSLTVLMSDALARIDLAGQHTTHGWRSTFTSIMAERDFRDEILLDLSIAHSAYKGSQSRYNHAQYVEQRRRILTEWSELLLQGASGAFALAGCDDSTEASNVVPLRGVAA